MHAFCLDALTKGGAKQLWVAPSETMSQNKSFLFWYFCHSLAKATDIFYLPLFLFMSFSTNFYLFYVSFFSKLQKMKPHIFHAFCVHIAIYS
jgi:hypothetical protein